MIGKIVVCTIRLSGEIRDYIETHGLIFALALYWKFSMKHCSLIGYISRLQNGRFLFPIRTWKAPWKDLDGTVTEILACETYAPPTPIGVSPQPSSFRSPTFLRRFYTLSRPFVRILPASLGFAKMRLFRSLVHF